MANNPGMLARHIDTAVFPTSKSPDYQQSIVRMTDSLDGSCAEAADGLGAVGASLGTLAGPRASRLAERRSLGYGCGDA